MISAGHIHIIGICGTFMGGLALFAKAKGYRVTGSDQNVYPPMSTQLEQAGIELFADFHTENLEPEPAQVIIGNALSRGNAEVEAVLNRNISYTSGAEWLARNILKDKWVLAVSGTHGKTSTASMLAWILEYAGLKPGFLIGGVPENFNVSARPGDSEFFVIEADEYDTAFFDKRSKFVHYRPRTLLINNIEFDHADIFAGIDDIKKQFHHLVRTVPAQGLIVYKQDDQNIQDTLRMGLWSATETIGDKWQAKLIKSDASEFNLLLDGKDEGKVKWQMLGEHNVANALGAISCARHSGVPLQHAIDALAEFKGIKRRMQVRGIVNDITVYDDFAHHPTAIKTTLSGLRNKVGLKRIIAVLEPRSNTMQMGVHNATLLDSLAAADLGFIYNPDNLKFTQANSAVASYDNIDDLLSRLMATIMPGDNIIIMSNGSFANIHQRLLELLGEHFGQV